MSYKYNTISHTEKSAGDDTLSGTNNVVETSYLGASGNTSGSSGAASGSGQQPLYTVSGSLKNVGINLLSLSLSLVILAYAAVSWRADGSPVGNREQLLLHISKYLTTAFPFVFGFIVSQSLKDLFNLQLEKGIRLAPAAYLSRGSTLGSVIGSIVSYRQIHWLPAAMLLVYSLSPLGSQATLRFVSIEPSGATHAPVQYIYPDATNTMEEAAPGIWENIAQSLFLSSVFSASSMGGKPQDTWANVKIPIYESLDASRKDHQGFVLVPTNTTEYTSLIGIPIAHSVGNFNSTFTIQSWYWRFQNSNLTSPLPTVQLSPQISPLLTNLTNNPTWSPHLPDEQTFQIAVGKSAIDSASLPIPLWFQDFNPTLNQSQALQGITNLSTTVTQTFVESKVSCNFTACAVTAMREASPFRNSTTDNVKGFGLWGMTNFGRAFPIPHPGSIMNQGILEAYLASPSGSNPFASQISSLSVNLYTVGADQIAKRLNLLINTYWIASNALSTAAGAFNTSFESLAPLSLNQNLINTTATVHVDSFHCNAAWFSVLVLATCAMIISSLVSIGVNRMRTGANDFTDFVWVLTHGKFSPKALRSSSLDVPGTLEALPRTKVQVGDAQPNERFGKAVIAEQSESLGRLTRDRIFA